MLRNPWLARRERFRVCVSKATDERVHVCTCRFGCCVLVRFLYFLEEASFKLHSDISVVRVAVHLVPDD